jgi:hypothetical protein
MRERFVTFGCALGALLLFGTLFLRSDTLAARRAAPPTTLERGANGLRGVASWLQGEGVRTLSLRERFGVLAQHHELAASGNLLIVSLPAASNFRGDELVALERWLRNGNTLLVLAALRDRPAWAQFPFVMSNDLEQLTGLSMMPEADTQGLRARPSATPPATQPANEPASRQASRQAPEPAARPGARRSSASARRRGEQATDIARLTTELTTPQRTALRPNGTHPYFTDVAQAVAFSDYAPLANTVSTPRDGFVLSLAHESGAGGDAFWTRPVGDGTIIVSAFGSLFSNRALGVADNARLLANLIAATVARDGTVLFDDQHQGLSSAYDAARFYRDPRLYATLTVIAAVWLSWVLGATRLQVPLQRASAPREAELVRTTGLFLARVLRPAAAARRLLEQFLERAARAAGRNPAQEEGLWEWLENHPLLRRSDVLQLRAWQSAARADRRVPLLRLNNLLVRTQRQLAQ